MATARACPNDCHTGASQSTAGQTLVAAMETDAHVRQLQLLATAEALPALALRDRHEIQRAHSVPQRRLLDIPFVKKGNAQPQNRGTAQILERPIADLELQVVEATIHFAKFRGKLSCAYQGPPRGTIHTRAATETVEVDDPLILTYKFMEAYLTLDKAILAVISGY